jgi:hypothetical protein
MRSRLVDAAAGRLASTAIADEPEITEAEMMKLLARIARTGKPGDRLRAIEMLGKQMGLFRDKPQAEQPDPNAREKLIERINQRLAALRPPSRESTIAVEAEKETQQ